MLHDTYIRIGDAGRNPRRARRRLRAAFERTQGALRRDGHRGVPRSAGGDRILVSSHALSGGKMRSAKRGNLRLIGLCVAKAIVMRLIGTHWEFAPSLSGRRQFARCGNWRHARITAVHNHHGVILGAATRDRDAQVTETGNAPCLTTSLLSRPKSCRL